MPTSYAHTIVIGGTGMLRQASLELARQSAALTLVARTRRSLDPLERAARELDCDAVGVAQDYRDTGALEIALREAQESRGAAQLTLAWIHDEEGPAPVAIARAVCDPERDGVRLVHVLGSAAADPARSLDSLRQRFDAFPRLDYQQVVLGFQREGDGSRWLTHDEISSGVLSAIDSGESPFVVGRVRPWALRP